MTENVFDNPYMRIENELFEDAARELGIVWTYISKGKGVFHIRVSSEEYQSKGEFLLKNYRSLIQQGWSCDQESQQVILRDRTKDLSSKRSRRKVERFSVSHRPRRRSNVTPNDVMHDVSSHVSTQDQELDWELELIKPIGRELLQRYFMNLH